MSWYIEVVYKPGMRPVVWSHGYPTKSSATAAKRRLVQTSADPNRKFTVKEAK